MSLGFLKMGPEEIAPKAGWNASCEVITNGGSSQSALSDSSWIQCISVWEHARCIERCKFFGLLKMSAIRKSLLQECILAYRCCLGISSDPAFLFIGSLVNVFYWMIKEQKNNVLLIVAKKKFRFTTSAAVILSNPSHWWEFVVYWLLNENHINKRNPWISCCQAIAIAPIQTTARL